MSSPENCVKQTSSVRVAARLGLMPRKPGNQSPARQDLSQSAWKRPRRDRGKVAWRQCMLENLVSSAGITWHRQRRHHLHRTTPQVRYVFYHRPCRPPLSINACQLRYKCLDDIHTFTFAEEFVSIKGVQVAFISKGGGFKYQRQSCVQANTIRLARSPFQRYLSHAGFCALHWH